MTQRTNDLASRVELIAQKAKQRKAGGKGRTKESNRAARTKKDAPPLGDEALLPYWSEQDRAVPNEIARSALFSIGNRKERRVYLADTAIAVAGKGQMRYRGEELRQDDADVWLYVLNMARQQPLGEWVRFSAYAFCKALGWALCGKSYERLYTCLSRLQATTLSIEGERFDGPVTVSLVRRFEARREGGKDLVQWAVLLEPEIQRLFGSVYFTLLDWQQRRELGPLARWLHAYFASHKQPRPVPVARLHEWCGSETKELRGFRQKLKSALEELVKIGFLKTWQINDRDFVCVTRAKGQQLIEK